MAHYAFLDENNIVTEVIVGKDEEDNIDWEQHYSQIRDQVCKRTSYNTYRGVHNKGGTPFRKNYAGIGYFYDEELDAFIPPKPFASWILNTETAGWESPVGSPPELTEEQKASNSFYDWNEETGAWTLFTPEV